jgi:3-hydroxyisobutyrate dehydrogenase
MRIGVIGLGRMGLAIAGRLRGQGLDPIGFDLDAARRDQAAALGVEVVTEAGAAASPAMLLSLPDDAAVGEALGLLWPMLPPGTLILDTSTLDPAAARSFAGRARTLGHRYLDAPVSGGPAGAAAGTLTFMLGGDAAGVEEARPILSALAGRVLHVGASGAGQVAKLVNNLLVATHLVAAAEAFRLGAAAGVAPDALVPVVNAASGRSAATEVNLPRWILSGTFDSGFGAGLMRKDVRLALGLAASSGVPLDACARAAAAWEGAGVPDDADFNKVPASLLAGTEGNGR